MVAIDLGSNTIRFIEFDGKEFGKEFEKIVRTAEGLNISSSISIEAIDRIIAAIKEAQGVLDFSSGYRAYTTAAMRLANNSTQALNTIYQETGILFTLIDAKKEAFLTLSAVRNRLSLINANSNGFVLADIGGGSTELIHINSSEEIQSLSINTGIVTLTEKINETTSLESLVHQFENSLNETIMSNVENENLILTAGTPTTIVAYLLGMNYKNYDSKRVNGFNLTLEQCFYVRDELLKMTESERQNFVGVGREDLIVAGIMMVVSIFNVLNKQSAIVIDDGLREGIALEYFLA